MMMGGIQKQDSLMKTSMIPGH
ncbi:MAG: hypothetical protein F4X92_10920 [Gammaproteobacteria bacterium]|nr:hypothetical protein [Gammaproteobacteria bacterium]